ncbi:MAG: diaminopimelate decarboxylase [Actinomycetota bacterium]|nr:diaminopimelate decarboxylase [Actinomycetota bacterium]
MRAHPAGPLHAGLAVPEGAPRIPADLGELDRAVWPRNAERRDGVLHLAEVDVRDLATDHGTPAYVLDETDFRSRCRDFADAFAGADVHYAGKAFLCGKVAHWVAEEGLFLDVCTGNELALALAAGFPADRISLHGNNKSTDELDQALAAGVGRVVLDSAEEIARLGFLAAQRGVRADVMLRATVGVEAHTHEFIATAHEDQKFGFSLASGAAHEAIRRVLALPGLRLVGVHSHIGSQIFDTAAFEVAAHRVVGLLRDVRDEHDVELPELNLGGGFGIAYLSEDDPAEPKTLASSLTAIVTEECRTSGLPVPRLAVEPGRAIAGPGTVSLYEVGTVKLVDLGGHSRMYVSVDGGMSDNIRAALYDATYTCVLASRTGAGRPMLARVVGKHCETGDIVVRDTWLPEDLVPGDLIAVAGTGAYCRSMASNYNQVGRPPVLGVKDGQTDTLVRRETTEDLWRLDPVLSTRRLASEPPDGRPPS